MGWVLKCGILYIIVVSVVAILLGCGRSSVENPVAPDDDLSADTLTLVQPTVTVQTSKSTVVPGDTVKITANVSTVRGSRLIFSWVNATGYGELIEINKNTATWKAPNSLSEGEVRVEVIQLVVTIISQVITVNESGVNTDTDIVAITKTVPLTITG